MSVIIPTTPFVEAQDTTELFPFPLDDFQKYAIHAIQQNEHCLITAHTGSGKSVPAEYAIHHFLSTNPDSIVIYTSPIKSLTNQKFHDFQGKFPEYSFGLLTGDIKLNPSGQCLLMTTEILRNALMRRDNVNIAGFENFELDLSRIACVIFDEIHYINDVDRGSVWEESILWLPRSIPMVLLSATLDKADVFARWIAERKEKNVWYLSNERRVVPLEHHMMVCLPKLAYKKTDKDNFVRILTKWTMDHSKTRECSVAPFMTEHGKMNQQNMSMLTRIRTHLSKQNIRLSDSFVINQMAIALKHMDKLPAVVFVFNRRLTEKMAKMVRNVMFPTEEGDSTVKGSDHHVGTDYQTTTMATQVVDRAYSILKKLPNWNEYTESHEFVRILDLMKKGVAYHHSGVHPVLREMIEILFQEGLIRLLFSTETLAVGVNMPARSVVMTSSMKWDGTRKRVLKSHEYTQMAGRAGRRGMDVRGYVYHLLWRDIPHSTEYESMLSGKPQSIVSKFKLSSLTLLRVLSAIALDTPVISTDDVVEQLKGTMIQQEVGHQVGQVEQEWRDIREKRDKLEKRVHELSTPSEILNEYHETKDKKLAMKYNLVREYSIWRDWKKLCDEDTSIQETMTHMNAYIPTAVFLLLGRLEEKGLIEKMESQTTQLTLTPLGKLMAQFHESPAEIAYIIDDVEQACRTEKTMIELLAGIAGGIVRVEGNDTPHTLTHSINKDIFRGIEKEQREEENWIRKQREQLDISQEQTCGFALVPDIIQWCFADEMKCKQVLSNVQESVFVGEWVKVLLKMVNIARELAMVFDKIGKVGCVAQLSSIPEKVMKSVVTNQSLYV